MNITDNVVDFMAGKIKRLPVELQLCLRTASCIGNQFDLPTVALTQRCSLDEARALMDQAAREGFIVLLENGKRYPFVHDRVQQAAIFLTPEAERAALHFRIDKIIMENTVEKDVEDRIFDIVDQLNWGIELIEDAEEKEKLVLLNSTAGRKAEGSAAYYQRTTILIRVSNYSGKLDGTTTTK